MPAIGRKANIQLNRMRAFSRAARPVYSDSDSLEVLASWDGFNPLLRMFEGS